MARLTILQASQQGFANTLTIHRCIKDGQLPVHEEGDTKLLEVDDLVGVFGEPGGTATADDETQPANTNLNGNSIDIGEYNRLKVELDQKNKKRFLRIFLRFEKKYFFSDFEKSGSGNSKVKYRFSITRK